MKHACVVLAILLTACVTKPVYNVDIHMAEGATMTTDIVVDKPMDVKPATQLDLDLIPSI